MRKHSDWRTRSSFVGCKMYRLSVRMRYVSLKRDTKDAFFYCDPPYYNSDMGHYDGYTIEDYEGLLKCLSKLKGKFLLSSYPSPILKQYVKAHGWHQKEVNQYVSVAGKGILRKAKIEVLTANYPIEG